MSRTFGHGNDKFPGTGLRYTAALLVGLALLGTIVAFTLTKKENGPKYSTSVNIHDAFGTTAPMPARVQWVGEMHKAIHEGDSAGKVRLSSLLAVPHLYAIGPVAGLRGEITVMDGASSLGIVGEGGVLATDQRDAEAAFLVWANVTSWLRIPLPDNVSTEEDIEGYLPGAVKSAGLSVDAPLPFRVEGRAVSMTLHVVWQEPGAPPGKETHDKSMVPATLTDSDVSIVGFWSDSHHGVFTPATSDIHMHALAKNAKISGHVDSVRLAPKAMLFVPAWRG